MKHTYTVYFESTRTHPKRAIKDLVASFAGIGLEKSGESTESENERESRALFSEARRRGFKCSFGVHTQYGRDDALSGELGILSTNSDDFWGTMSKDAFDFSTGCPRCGLGAAQVRPHLLSERCVRYKGNFLGGDRGTCRDLIRSEIAREIIEATGQPWCMRHPVTRGGQVIEEWMEPVPCATMPPLSRKSEGVSFGSTDSSSRVGEPPQAVPPCPVCGRVIWDYDHEQHTRLVYPRAAVEAAQKHAVVVMHEPYASFPTFDPVKRRFKDLYGLPWLLFNRTAIKVLVRYMQTEHVRTMSYVQPVFAE